jgi:hypothetical protein
LTVKLLCSRCLDGQREAAPDFVPNNKGNKAGKFNFHEAEIESKHHIITCAQTLIESLFTRRKIANEHIAQRCSVQLWQVAQNAAC